MKIMKNGHLLSIMLLLLTLLIFGIFLEAAARVLAHFSNRFLCDTFSKPDDWFLCRLEFDLGKGMEKNRSAVLLDKKICDKWDSELGWIPNPNCNSVRGSVKYSTNSHGFRNSMDFNLEKNRKRIIIVGDSFTWGENNLDNETYPYYLDELFNYTIDVINMGVHGYGPDQFYLYFMRDGLKYKPDVVIFGLFLPDIHRTTFRVRSFFKPRFIIEEGALKLDNVSAHIPDLRTALEKSHEIKNKKRSYALSYFLGAFNKLMRLATAYKEETNLTLRIIEQMNEQLKKEDIRLIVLLIPEQEMVEKGNTGYYGVVPKLTIELENQKIHYINLQPVFKSETELRSASLYQGHLKPEGNRVVANELYRNLTNPLFLEKR